MATLEDIYFTPIGEEQKTQTAVAEQTPSEDFIKNEIQQWTPNGNKEEDDTDAEVLAGMYADKADPDCSLYLGKKVDPQERIKMLRSVFNPTEKDIGIENALDDALVSVGVKPQDIEQKPSEQKEKPLKAKRTLGQKFYDFMVTGSSKEVVDDRTVGKFLWGLVPPEARGVVTGTSQLVGGLTMTPKLMKETQKVAVNKLLNTFGIKNKDAEEQLNKYIDMYKTVQAPGKLLETDTVNKFVGDLGRSMIKFAKEESPTGKLDKDILGYLKEGDFFGAGNRLWLSIWEQFPQFGGQMLATHLGLTNMALPLIGASAAGSKYEELEDTESSDVVKVLNPIITGTFEAVFEKITTFKWMKGLKEGSREPLKKTIFGVLKAMTPMVEESLGETGTQLSENILDMFTIGTRPDGSKINWWDGLSESAIVGFFMPATSVAQDIYTRGFKQSPLNKQISDEIIKKSPELTALNDAIDNYNKTGEGFAKIDAIKNFVEQSLETELEDYNRIDDANLHPHDKARKDAILENAGDFYKQLEALAKVQADEVIIDKARDEVIGGLDTTQTIGTFIYDPADEGIDPINLFEQDVDENGNVKYVMTPEDRMRNALHLYQQGSLSPEYLTRIVNEYSEESGDTSVETDLERITGKPLTQFDAESELKLNDYLEDQFMKNNFREEWEIEKIKEQLEGIENVSFYIDEEIIPQPNGTDRIEYSVNPNQFIAREIFQRMQKLADTSRYKGRYYDGSFYFETKELAQTFANQVQNEMNAIISKAYESAPEITVSGDDYNIKVPVDQKVDTKKKPTEEAAIEKPKTQKPKTLNDVFGREVNIVQSKDGLPLEVKIPDKAEVRIPKVPEKMDDKNSQNIIKSVQRTWEDLDNLIKTADKRAEEEYKYILGTTPEKIQNEQVGEMVIQAQKGSQSEAQKIWDGLNDYTKEYVWRARDMFLDTDAFEDAWNRTKKEKFQKRKDFIWHLQGKNYSAMKATEGLFDALSSVGSQIARKEDVPIGAYSRDSMATLKKYLTERRRFIDAVEAKEAIESLYNSEQIVSEMMNDTELGRELTKQSEKITNLFKENGMEINVFDGSAQQVNQKLNDFKNLKEIFDGTEEGEKLLKQADDIKKKMDKFQIEVPFMTDRQLLKNYYLTKSMSLDRGIVPLLKPSALTRAIGEFIDPGQITERMDNMNIHKEGYGGNRNSLYDAEKANQQKNIDFDNLEDEIPLMAHDLGIDMENKKERIKFQDDVRRIFNELNSYDIIEGNENTINKKLSESASSESIQVAKKMADNLYKVNKYLKDRLPQTKKTDYTPSQRKAITKGDIFDKYAATMKIYVKEKNLGDYIQNMRVWVKNLEARGFVDEANWWNKYIEQGLIGNMGSADDMLSLEKWQKTINLPWTKKMNKDAFVVKLKHEGWSDLAINAELERLQSENNYDGETVKLEQQFTANATDIMRALQWARVNNRLKYNVAWSLRTQWLSQMWTLARYGIVNSLMKAPLKRLQGKYDQSIKENPAFAIKRDDNSFRIAMSDEEIKSAIKKRKNVFQRVGTGLDAMSNFLEKELDLLTMISADMKAEQLGLEGRDRDIFLSDAISRTQSVYNKSKRALILNNDTYRTALAHNSYAVTAMNNFAEYLGYQKMDAKERGLVAMRLAGTIATLGVLARLTASAAFNSEDDSWEEGMWQFVNNVLSRNGDTVTEQFARFITSTDVTDTFGAILDGIVEKEIKGYSYNFENPSTLIPIIGDDLSVYRAFRRWIEKGNPDQLRKELVNIMGWAGVGGASTANRIIDTLLGLSSGDILQGKSYIKYGTTGDIINSLFFGKSASPAAQKSFRKGKDDLTIGSFFSEKRERKGRSSRRRGKRTRNIKKYRR